MNQDHENGIRRKHNSGGTFPYREIQINLLIKSEILIFFLAIWKSRHRHLDISIGSESAFKYKHCLLHNINHVLRLSKYFLSPIQQFAMCSVMSHDNI